MVRVLKLGTKKERPKRYFKAICNHCQSELIFEYGDIWFEDVVEGTGRVECPICRTKVFLNTDMVELPYVQKIEDATETEFNNAITDTSKSGLQMLMDEKKQETRRLSPSEVADVFENESDLDSVIEHLTNKEVEIK